MPGNKMTRLPQLSIDLNLQTPFFPWMFCFFRCVFSGVSFIRIVSLVCPFCRSTPFTSQKSSKVDGSEILDLSIKLPTGVKWSWISHGNSKAFHPVFCWWERNVYIKDNWEFMEGYFNFMMLMKSGLSFWIHQTKRGHSSHAFGLYERSGRINHVFWPWSDGRVHGFHWEFSIANKGMHFTSPSCFATLPCAVTY